MGGDSGPLQPSQPSTALQKAWLHPLASSGPLKALSVWSKLSLPKLGLWGLQRLLPLLKESLSLWPWVSVRQVVPPEGPDPAVKGRSSLQWSMEEAGSWWTAGAGGGVAEGPLPPPLWTGWA